VEIALLIKQKLNGDHSIDPDPQLKTLEAERNKLLLAEQER